MQKNAEIYLKRSRSLTANSTVERIIVTIGNDINNKKEENYNDKKE